MSAPPPSDLASPRALDPPAARAPGPKGGGTPPEGARPPAPDVEVSVVMPCLDEEASVGSCVRSALDAIARLGRRGEVIVSDNGSVDRSVERALEAGARVVHEPVRGYGSAYLRGFAEARGRYLIMGDSDGTYDFSRLGDLISKLDEGYDYVLGSRFAGSITRGAMPWSHRYIGNPVLTGILNRFFGLANSDAHSGFRAFTRAAYERMDLRCPGMEFASEMVIKASRAGLRMTEVPIVYRPRIGESKLKAVRDAWRHLRFLLLACPRYLFSVPGLALFATGLLGQTILVLTGPSHRLLLDMHLSALLALVTLLGSQAVLFGTVARARAASMGLDPPDAVSAWIKRHFTLERGIVTSLLILLLGLGADIGLVIVWLRGPVAPLEILRRALLALDMIVLGMQGLFASFLLDLLGSGREGA